MDNPYIFGNPDVDRQRLETQTHLIGERVKANAHLFVGEHITNILDLGCGDGQLGLLLHAIYPEARLMGIDKDPKAVLKAREHAQAQGFSQATYVVGDIEAALPEGQYDLVFASLILLHTRQLPPVVARIAAATQPGGYLWATELHPGFRTAIDHPAYQQLAAWFFATMAAIGVQPLIGQELPILLRDAGFTDVHTKTEEFPLGGTSYEAQATLATLLGGFYNARLAMSKTQGVPESEIIQLYTELANYALRTRHSVGAIPSLHIVARREAAA